MQHLDSLFALAQVVSSNAEQAVQLVEATFRRAFTTSTKPYEPPRAESLSDSEDLREGGRSPGTESDEMPTDLDPPEQARVWLFRLMMQIRRERVDAGVNRIAGETSEHEAEPRAELSDLRRQLADEYIDTALPQAFATLPSEDRMLLMMCDVERMGCEDAGRVLDLEPSVSCRRLEEAHVSLHRALYANATTVERHLLDTGLPGNWKRAALQRMAESRLVTVPPTLRPSVVSIFKGMSQAGKEGVEHSDDVGDADRLVSTDTAWPGLLKRFGAVLAIIVVAGLLGYAFSNITDRESNGNLISLSAQQAEAVETNFETTSAEQAERYIYERLGSRITLPTIAEADLQGVSIRSVVRNAEVPVLLFQDRSTGLPITVYVYSYAFLDRHQKDLVLERDILRQIEMEGNFDLHDLGSEKALVWRNRDDIFIAITSDDAEALRGRIAYPS